MSWKSTRDQSGVGTRYHRYSHGSEGEPPHNPSPFSPFAHRASFIVLVMPKIWCKIQTSLQTGSSHEEGCGEKGFTTLFFLSFKFGQNSVVGDEAYAAVTQRLTLPGFSFAMWNPYGEGKDSRSWPGLRSGGSRHIRWTKTVTHKIILINHLHPLMLGSRVCEPLVWVCGVLWRKLVRLYSPRH